jgi:type I restriction enzyme M protein
MAINTVVKSIQDIMRQDTGVDGDAQRISQLVWMLFLKIFDDKEKEYELLNPKYASPIPEELRWRRWANDDAGITGDELIDFVNNKLFKGLKNLSFQEGDDPKGYIVKQVFEDAYNYMKSGTLMRQVINKIDNEIDFTKREDSHVFNDIYEKILSNLQNAGNAGEYYTPRAVTKFIVEMNAPKLGEKVLDPACGTGGFLVDSIEFIRANNVKTADDEKVLQESIFGIEKKPLPHMLCTTNLILHGFEVPKNVRRDNTLSRPLRDYTSKDRVDVILTNPPFGGVEEEGIDKGFPKQFQTKETADLFLVLIMELLKDGGRAGIVLPDGSLFGEGVKTRIKAELLETCNLHTIIRLPNGVFAPYTSISTNLLFFQKGKPTKEVWYFEHPLPENLTNGYNKGKSFNISEMQLEKDWWNNRVENDYAWKVSIEDIKSRNYNLDIKNPKKQKEESKVEIPELLDTIKQDISTINELFEKLQNEFNKK